MLKKITFWLLSFLELQLVITLLSLPILIHWGLAISCMSPVGNLIFTPLLTLFLWGSSLFSFCHILNIPSTWINSFLDCITHTWNYLLSFSNPTWLIGFCHSTIWLAIAIAIFIVAFYTLYHPTKKQAFYCLSICFCILLLQRQATPKLFLHQVNNLPLYILKINNKTYLLDDGAICRKQNFYSWIDYTILPELIKTAGITTIDTLVLYKPNKREKIIKQFVEQMNIKTVFTTTKQKYYLNIRSAIENKNIKVLPLGKKQNWLKS